MKVLMVIPLILILIFVYSCDDSLKKFPDNLNSCNVIAYVSENSLVVETYDCDEEPTNISLSCCDESTNIKLSKVKENTYMAKNIFHSVLEDATINWELSLNLTVSRRGSLSYKSSEKILIKSKPIFFDFFGNMVMLENNRVYIYPKDWFKNPISTNMTEILDFSPESHTLYRVNKNEEIILLTNNSQYSILLVNNFGNILDKLYGVFDTEMPVSNVEIDVWNKRLLYYNEGNFKVHKRNLLFDFEPEVDLEKDFISQLSGRHETYLFINENFIYQVVNYKDYPYYYMEIRKSEYQNNSISDPIIIGSSVSKSKVIGKIIPYDEYLIIPYVYMVNESSKTLKYKFLLLNKANNSLENLKNSDGDDVSIDETSVVYIIKWFNSNPFILEYSPILKVMRIYEISKVDGRGLVSDIHEESLNIPKELFLLKNLRSKERGLEVIENNRTLIFNSGFNRVDSYDNKEIIAFWGDYMIYKSTEGYFVSRSDGEWMTIQDANISYFYEQRPSIKLKNLEINDRTLKVSMGCLDKNFETSAVGYELGIVFESNVATISSATFIICSGSFTFNTNISSYFLENGSLLCQDFRAWIVDSLGNKSEYYKQIDSFCGRK